MATTRLIMKMIKQFIISLCIILNVLYKKIQHSEQNY